MAIFEVELNNEVVKTFEAETYTIGANTFTFYDDDNQVVGTIITQPGMSVTKQGHGGPAKQRR